MSENGAGDVKAVVFDMGGVLVELGPLDEALGLGRMTSEEFWAAWLASPTVRALEAGVSTVEEFGRDLGPELGLDLDPAEIIAHFKAVPRGLFPGAAELVAAVRAQVTTALLSNTNAAHWETQPDADVIAGMCAHQFLSYELNLTKPDRPIFDHAATALGVEPGRILFLDDSPANVTGARDAGWLAERVRGPLEARAALERHGVLAPRPAD